MCSPDASGGQYTTTYTAAQPNGIWRFTFLQYMVKHSHCKIKKNILLRHNFDSIDLFVLVFAHVKLKMALNVQTFAMQKNINEVNVEKYWNKNGQTL